MEEQLNIIKENQCRLEALKYNANHLIEKRANEMSIFINAGKQEEE